MSEQKDYLRNNRLIRRKFSSYLLPMTLTMAALSLNEFVDSMVVSNLLGADAMAVVNLGMPVMLFMAFAYTILGNGGATLFATALGERNRKYAGTCFNTAMLTATAAGFVLLGLGFLFFQPISRLLCREAELFSSFEIYLRVELISAPLIVVMLTFLEFLPPCGIPSYATVINIIANGVNLAMDVIYIKYLHMGVEGAAYATLTGYTAGLIPIIWVLARRRIQIPKGKLFDWKALKSLSISGGSPAAVQLGFTLKFSYSNSLAAMLGGTAGVIAFSLCIQAISFVTIFMGGAITAAAPLISVLRGQKDYYGETAVLKSALRVTMISMVISAAAFFIFPRQVAAIYSITDPVDLETAARALRIFAATFILRGFCMVMMRYLQATGNNRFSLFISLFDGCIGILPITWLCTTLIGLDGVWLAYPVTALLLVLIVILRNLAVARRSNGHLSGILLSVQEDPAIRLRSWTIPEEKPAWLSEALTAFCLDSGLSERVSRHAGLVAEEMVLYTWRKSGKPDYMDVTAREYPGRVEIDFRSLGEPLNPLLPYEEIEKDAPDGSAGDLITSLKLLREIADKLDYEHVMGMNCTHAEIGCASR